MSLPADLMIVDARVLHCDVPGGRIEPCDILIRRGHIAAMVRPRTAMRGPAVDMIDANGGLVMPGLVNAHTHSPENLARGRAERARLRAWMAEVWPTLDALPTDMIALAVDVGAAEMIRYGVTAVVDHFRQTPMTEAALAAAIEAYAGTGLRTTLAVMLRDAASGNALAGAPHVDGAPSAADQVALVSRLMPAARRRGVELGFGPSAPHRCTEALLRITQAHGGTPIHTHVDETADDAAQARRRFGKSTIAYLDSLGLLGPQMACAHAVHITEDDIARLAACGAVVIHNPISNLRLGSGIAPVAALLEAGVAVGLGTDGAASNDAQNPWEAIKLSALLPRLGRGTPDQWPAAETILTCATRMGHRATGLATRNPLAGTIAVGAAADLIVFDDDPLAQIDMVRPAASLVFGSPDRRPRHVVARGRVLLRDNTLTTIDEDRLRHRLRARQLELAA